MNFIKKIYYEIKTLIKLYFVKAFHWNTIFIGRFPYFKGHVDIDLSENSLLKLGNRVKMMEGGRIGVRKNGELVIGDRASINVGTMIICHEKIEIGEDTQIGPYCQILDHDHVYKTEEDLDSQKFNTSPVLIGKHVWIGANCVILRGTVIGDHCVVAAGTVLKGVYESNSLIYTKREVRTRKIISSAEEKL